MGVEPTPTPPTFEEAVAGQLDGMLADLGRLERLVRGPGRLPPLELAKLSVERGHVAKRLRRVGCPLWEAGADGGE